MGEELQFLQTDTSPFGLGPPFLISLSPDCLPKTPLQKPFNLGVLHQHLDFEGIQVSL